MSLNKNDVLLTMTLSPDTFGSPNSLFPTHARFYSFSQHVISRKTYFFGRFFSFARVVGVGKLFSYRIVTECGHKLRPNVRTILFRTCRRQSCFDAFPDDRDLLRTGRANAELSSNELEKAHSTFKRWRRNFLCTTFLSKE